MCVPTWRLDFNERDACLDEPACHETALAERCAAVGVTDVGGLGLQIERLDPRAEHHLRGLMIERLMVLDLIGGSTACERGFQFLEQAEAATQAVTSDGRCEVIWRTIGIGHDKRRELDAEKTG